MCIDEPNISFVNDVTTGFGKIFNNHAVFVEYIA